MCGIIAFLGKMAGSNHVLEGIQILRNRGYDSMGCCSIKPGKPMVITRHANQKDTDSFDLFQRTFKEHDGCNCLMAHCRWATTGRVTDENSHPHIDTVFPNRLSVVHNGIISNYIELRNYLEDQGIEFKSETDTEVIVNLIAHYQKKNPELTLMDAIKLTLKELEGTWALIIMNSEEPNTLYVCKKGSPILVGYSEDMCLVSSEISGFSNYLKTYHEVQDDQIIKIQLHRNRIHFYKDNQLTKLSSQNVIHQTLYQTSPDPYPHWTLKEIMEQPEAVSRALNGGGRIKNDKEVMLGGLKRHIKELDQTKHLIILASGTSMHAGLLGLKYFQSMSGFDTVRVIDASEFTLHDLTPSSSAILGISQSGETRDVVRCIEMIRDNRPDIIIFSIVNVVESLIAREADCGVYLNAGREVGVASTKSFTNQTIVLILIAIWFAQNRKLCPTLRANVISSLRSVQDLIEQTLTMIKEPCERLVNHLKDHKHLFILGREKGYPVALEGALKIKELSYIHAEGYAGGGLKHGPLALIEQNTPIIVIRIGDCDIKSKMDVAAEETKSRGAYLVMIGSSGRCAAPDIYDEQIIIPNSLHLEPILATIPLQYLAYLLANALGYSPDYPRNLAKCVTVD